MGSWSAGMLLLVAMSFGFGIIAQLVAGRATTRWLWLIAAAGYFVGGLFIRGRVVEGTERKAKVHVTAHIGDTLIAEFEGTFVAVPQFEY